MYDLREFVKYYPKGFYGQYKYYELDETKLFAMMNTKDSNFLIENLKLVENNFEKETDFEKVVEDNPTNEEFGEWIQHKSNYFKILKILSFEMREQLYKNRSNQFIIDKFSDSFLPDAMVNSLIYELEHNLSFRMNIFNAEKRKEIFESLMTQILEKSDQPHTNLSKINQWFKDIKILEFELDEYELKKNIDGFETVHKKEGSKTNFEIVYDKRTDYLKTLPEMLSKGDYGNLLSLNSGLFMHGTAGTGKSCALGYATTYAYRKDWIVLKVVDSHEITQNSDHELIRHEDSRLYFQTGLAVEILEDFLQSNKGKIENIPVNMDIYGKYTTSGCHKDEPEVVKNIYDEWRQSHFFDSDDLVVETREDTIIEQRYLRETLGERLRKPENLAEIAEYGIKHQDWSINAVAEILEQLYALDSHKVLIAVDAFNDLYRKTEYLDYRYETDRALRGHIPPYHLALARLFMRLDGHKIKNGLKLVASSNRHLYKHIFNPGKLNFPTEGYDIEMQPLDIDQVRTAVVHYGNTKKLPEDTIDENLVQVFYLETQGNWGELAQVGYNYYLRGYRPKEWRTHKQARQEMFDSED